MYYYLCVFVLMAKKENQGRLKGSLFFLNFWESPPGVLLLLKKGTIVFFFKKMAPTSLYVLGNGIR